VRAHYYLRILPNGAWGGVWEIGQTTARNIDAVSAELPGSYFKAEPGETVWQAIKRGADSWNESDFHKIDLRPGEYHPRIARPIDPHPKDFPPGTNPGASVDSNLIAMARGQLTTLTRQLDRICQTVHPSIDTCVAYGHDIRNLLILACTEAEMHWRGVLVANGRPDAKQLGTRDYVLLMPAMKLDEYAVTFLNYPWLDPISPYAGWGATGKPTQDLKWYDAYNAAKHNREREFQRATLRHAFEAVSACLIMMVAQFGVAGIGQRSELEAFFGFARVPTWDPSKVYIVPRAPHTRDWSPIHFPFGNAVP